MRPIDKGAWPTNPESNEQIDFTIYQKAKDYLVERTGTYCQICEREVEGDFQIEHILPKKHYPQHKGNWDYFLLICFQCNRTKWNDIPAQPFQTAYFWPHIDNTLLKFAPDIINNEVKPVNNLSQEDTNRALNMIELYGLNKTVTRGGTSYAPSNKRVKAIVRATGWLNTYENSPEENRNNYILKIIDSAADTGYFSIWFYVFRNHNEVREELVKDPRFHQNLSWYDDKFNPK